MASCLLGITFAVSILASAFVLTFAKPDRFIGLTQRQHARSGAWVRRVRFRVCIPLYLHFFRVFRVFRGSSSPYSHPFRVFWIDSVVKTYFVFVCILYSSAFCIFLHPHFFRVLRVFRGSSSPYFVLRGSSSPYLHPLELQ